jgi:hypothetical protein
MRCGMASSRRVSVAHPIAANWPTEHGYFVEAARRSPGPEHSRVAFPPFLFDLPSKGPDFAPRLETTINLLHLHSAAAAEGNLDRFGDTGCRTSEVAEHALAMHA